MIWHRKVCVSVCTLNQWALDFTGNLRRINKSIELAHSLGAKIRVGPELEIPGYGCQDHFHEMDTEHHSWEVLENLLQSSKKFKEMLIATGMPVRFNTELYNCMIAIQNGEVLLIRPKMKFCDDDVYRESRYFVRWQRPKEVTEYHLPFINKTVPFGDAVLRMADGVMIGFEMCEELWTSRSPHVDLALHGVDIICNGSASHHVLGKSAHRINHLVLASTAKVGGIYLYSNLRGCDGDRVYYDGMSSIAQNGKLFAQIPQFDLDEVSCASALLDLQDNYSFRSKIYSTMSDAAVTKKYPEVDVPDGILEGDEMRPTSNAIEPVILSKEEELLNGPPAYLWNYLRRSGMQGFFLPLSGGADSASVAVMVRSMCEKVYAAYSEARKDPSHDREEFKLAGEEINVNSADELCKKVFFTCYMQSKNSSQETRSFAQELARQISSNHLRTEIDETVEAFVAMASSTFGVNFSGSPPWEDPRLSLGMQNVQARIRMVTAYLFAQLALYFNKRPGSLLVLGSSNVDESLVGYVTKYDCSAADLNPIGSMMKSDLKAMLRYARDTMGLTALSQIIEAPPTAELLPRIEGQPPQLDEVEIGLTYEEMAEIGQLRKPGCLGPYGTFLKLLPIWHDSTPEEVAIKVKRFYRRYGANRHKATVLTPAYHAERYSCDDHRNDHRPFLYNGLWEWQFEKIDQFIKEHSVQKGVSCGGEYGCEE
uniref:Glutamine-dependent NAD(+) synthetase n=1 Tax=Parascaris univalens TaxID=6257 RepID=A0A915AML6_PARUN